MSSHPTDAAAPSDAELITSVRAGDISAYEELYRRHAGAARAAARSVTRSPADVDDLVSEAFARVLSVLQRGAGPELAFRPYLLTAVRNAFYDKARKDQRVDVTDEVPEDLNALVLSAAAGGSEERDLILEAFASLPERWQMVLWHTEVEGRTPAEIAPLLGIAPNAVAALSYRAREGLRQAYLKAHMRIPPPDACQPFAPKLAAYVRNDLSARDRRKIEDHLATCDRCPAIVAELQETNRHLGALLIPLLLGVPATTYLAEVGALAGAGRVRRRKDQQAQASGVGGLGPLAVAGLAAAVLGVVVVGAVAITQLGDGDGELAGPSATSQDGTSAVTPGPASTLGPDLEPTTVATIDGSPPGGVATPPPGADSTSGVAATAGSGAIGGEGDGTRTTRAAGPTTAPPAATTSPSPATTAPSPPTTTPPTTAAPPPELAVAFGVAGPALSGLVLGLPVSVGNGVPAEAASWRQEAAGPALAPVVSFTLPAGVGLSGSDNPAWTCSSSPTAARCITPPLGPGDRTSATLSLPLAPDLVGRVELTPSVSDGANPPVLGPTIVIEVVPAGDVDDLVVTEGRALTVGNTVLTCPFTAASCEAGRAGTATPPPLNDKSSYEMLWVDVDGDPATVTSSSATIALPAGARVIEAHLVWSATLTAGAGGVPAPDAATAGTVRLTGPAGPATVTASRLVPGVGPDGGGYWAEADVTALVQASGTYTVAGIQAGSGRGRSGGWSIVAFVNEPGSPRRALALIRDPVPITPTTGGFDAVVPGLVPGTRSVTLDVVLFEGDRGVQPEEVRLNGKLLSNAENPRSASFNTSECCSAARSPADANTFSIDVDRYVEPVTITSDGVVDAELSTSQDAVLLGVAAVAVDL